MRAAYPKASHVKMQPDQKKARKEQVSLHKNVTLRKEYLAQKPPWKRPTVGYILSIPLVASLLGITLMIQNSLTKIYFPGSLLILSVLFAAFIWGVGPALFALVLSSMALDYFFIPPESQFDLHTLHGSIQILPYAISGLIVAIITAQRETARLQALAAQQDAQEAAEELEESNKKLQEASNLKDRFLSIASHELKTPITTIRGLTQLVLRRLSKQQELSPEMEDMKKTWEKINEQTTRLTALIDELLDVSSIRAGKMVLHKQACDLVQMCRDLIEDQQLLTGRPITLETTSEHMPIYADCERLGQVIVNLLSNAIKYSPKESPIEVRLCQQSDTLYIVVVDYGKGIPPDQQGRIFETFYRAPDAQSSAKGLGLGLAITKDIVERHNGHIWCESKPGQGSTFIVKLPLNQEDDEQK
jgi:signal transduction histidine kinase